MNSPHQILGIPVTASPAQIRAAHRQLALRLHPDRTDGRRQTAGSTMAGINAARDALLTKAGKLTPLARRLRSKSKDQSTVLHQHQTIFRDGRPVGSVDIIYAEATNAAMRELLEQVTLGEPIDIRSIVGAGLNAVTKKGARR